MTTVTPKQPPGPAPTQTSDVDSAGPSEDMARRFAVLHALGEGATIDASRAGLTSAPAGAQESARYSFEEVFASGGLGTIRRAYDHRLERHVAIKELQSYQPGGASEARFQREALLTARLEHPSIVPIQDRGQHPDGAPFYCMKLVDGQSLDALVRARPGLGDRLALVPHVLAVADALAYAHARGVVHRDLKPANILVGRFGETLVIDWGLAKDLLASDAELDVRAAPVRSDAPSDDLTRTGEFVGTLPFMPLEQAEGGATDARADVYAIGAILYFVLSGCLPYEGRPTLGMLAAMLAGPPPDLTTRVAGVPADLLAIVRKAMARAPADRYVDAGQLAADLRRFQAGRMVAARSYSPVDALRHFGNRHRAIAGVAAVGVVLAAGIGAYSYAQVVAQRQAAEEQRAEAVAAREAESDALAVSEQRRAESEAQALAARTSAARMLTESGRRELFERHRPQQALVLLAEAARTLGDAGGMRTMLAEATRAVDARRATLAGHTGGVKTLAHAPDGERLLVRSGDGGVHVWAAASGEALARLAAGDEHYADAVFVVDDAHDILTYTREGTLRRHGADGKVLREAKIDPKTLGPNPALRSLGGDMVLLVHGTGVVIVDLASGKATPGVAPTGAGPRVNPVLAATPGQFALTEAWVASDDYTSHHFRVLRWDLAHGGVKGSRDLQRQLLAGIAASPDGRQVAFVAPDGAQALWDVEAEKQTTLASCGPFPARDLDPFEGLGFDPGGAYLVRLVGEQQVARWDLASGACDRVGAPLGSATKKLAVTPDGRQLVVAHEDAEVSLLDAATLDQRLRFLAHTRPISAISVAPDSATLATGSEDGEVRLWSLADPRVLQRVEVSHVAAGADDGRVFALGRRHDGVVTQSSIMDMMNEKAVEPGGARPLQRIDLEPGPGAAPTLTTLDPDATAEHLDIARGSLLLGASAWGRSAMAWSTDAPGRRGAIDFAASNHSGRLVALSPDERTLWVRGSQIVGEGNELLRYGLPGFTLERSLPLRIDEISPQTLRGVVFAEYGASMDVAKVHDLESGALVGEVKGAFGNFSPAGDRLFTGTMDGAIRVYDPVTATLVATLREPTAERMNALTWGTAIAVFSHDKSMFATSRIDGTIDLWRSDSLAWVRELHGHLGPARRFEWSADDTRLLSHRWQPSGGDTMTFLWHLDGDDARGTRLDVSDLYAARFSPDGRLLATGSSDGVVLLWSADDGELAAELRGHANPVTILEFARSGERLLSAADNDAAITWQVPVERRETGELATLIAAQVPFTLVDGEVVRR